MSDQGTPSSRCARRSRSATCSVSERSVSKVTTSTRPSPNALPAGCGVAERRERRRVDGALGRDGGRDRARGGEQPRPEPPGDPQRDRVGGPAVGVRELLGEVEDAAHLGTAEAVDGLVGVADDDEVAAVAGERLEQPDLARVGVLVLVDEDVVEPAPQVGADLGTLGEQDRPVDQLRVVDRRLVVEDHLVLLHEPGRGDELGGLRALPHLLEVERVEPLLPGARQHRLPPRARTRGCRAPGTARPATARRPPRGCPRAAAG